MKALDISSRFEHLIDDNLSVKAPVFSAPLEGLEPRTLYCMLAKDWDCHKRQEWIQYKLFHLLQVSKVNSLL